MFDSPKSNNNINQKLNDPDKSLEDVISSKDFLTLWEKSDSTLLHYLYKHYDDLIEIGFQTKSESINSIRCLQILCSSNPTFHQHLKSKTNLYKFVYDYIFNISSYPSYSQKNYFYVLPNLMVDKSDDLNPTFTALYFMELFQHVDNDYAFNFILRLFEFAPKSIFKILKEIKIDDEIISNILRYNSKDTESKVLLVRNQILFKELLSSKFDGDIGEVIHHQIGKIVRNSIRNPNIESISFLMYLNNISTSKTSFSKWYKVQHKIAPYLPHICNMILKSSNQTFTPLYESCTLLAISIISSTKDVPEIFIELFKYLLQLFFVLKTNTFLHNCVVKAFKALVSVGKINSAFLDELDLFKKITDCYVNRNKDGYSPNWGQLRQISEEMNQFVNNSKTVDIEKWKKIVMRKNEKQETIINSNFGGFIPPDFNGIKRFFWRRKYFDPTFTSKNLSNENKQPKKFLISSPLY